MLERVIFIVGFFFFWGGGLVELNGNTIKKH